MLGDPGHAPLLLNPLRYGMRVVSNVPGMTRSRTQPAPFWNVRNARPLVNKRGGPSDAMNHKQSLGYRPNPMSEFAS